MKFLFSTEFASREEALALLPIIRQAGFDGVEPTFLPDGFPSVRSFREDAAEFRLLAEAEGLVIPSMRGGPLFWPRFSATDPDKRQEAVALADKAAETVRLLGGQVLLLVPGRWEPDQLYADLYANALDTAVRSADVASRHGITIGLENVDNQFLLSPSEWRQFLDRVNRPEIRLYYDIGNTVYSRLGHPAQWIRELGIERICRIHVKDATRRGQIVPLRSGEVNWAEAACGLADIGYDDWIGAELPLPPASPLAFLIQTRSALKEIWGE
jgi:hexulose-6-phosphate isomerase